MNENEAARLLMKLAAERLGRDEGLMDRPLTLHYHADVDMLVIRFKDKPHATRTEDDSDRALLFNYEGEELVSIEVLDIYGVFV